MNRDTISFLNPEMFDTIVLAAKEEAGYDENEKTYKAARLAMHYETTVVQISNLAYFLVVKKSLKVVSKREDQMKELTRFSFLVQSQWTNEVASLAAKCLVGNRFDTPTIFPLKHYNFLFVVNFYCHNS